MRLRSHRIVQHLLGKISLGAIGACVGIAALNVAVLAAVDIFVRADSRIGAAVGVVIGRRVNHDGLAAFEAASEKRGDQEECEGKAHF